MSVTEAEFKRFERVRVSGVTNMMSPDVQEIADIDKATHLEIMGTYSDLMKQYPNVREES